MGGLHHDILIPDLLFDDFADKLNAGALDQAWKTEIDAVAALDEDFTFVTTTAQLSVITAGSEFKITDTDGKELFIVLDPVENVFDIRTGVLVNVEVAVLTIAPRRGRYARG